MAPCISIYILPCLRSSILESIHSTHSCSLRMHTNEGNGVADKTIVLSVRFQPPDETLKLSKSDGVVHCSV